VVEDKPHAEPSRVPQNRLRPEKVPLWPPPRGAARGPNFSPHKKVALYIRLSPQQSVQNGQFVSPGAAKWEGRDTAENLAYALGGFFCFPRRSWRNQFLRSEFLVTAQQKKTSCLPLDFCPAVLPSSPPSVAAGLFFKFPEPMAMSRVPDRGV